MSLDEIKDMFFLQTYLLNNNVEQIVKGIHSPKLFLYFLDRINVLLDSKNYLLFFDRNQVVKIKAIIEQMTFVYSSFGYIKKYHRIVYHKLCVMDSNFKRYGYLADGILKTEKKLRCLPEAVNFDVEVLNQFNKKDFDNYNLLLYHNNCYEKVDFISFFSTVNKMCSLNHCIFEDLDLRLGFKIALFHFENLCDDEVLLEYASNTLDRVEKNKVYKFPNLK